MAVSFGAQPAGSAAVAAAGEEERESAQSAAAEGWTPLYRPLEEGTQRKPQGMLHWRMRPVKRGVWRYEGTFCWYLQYASLRRNGVPRCLIKAPLLLPGGVAQFA